MSYISSNRNYMAERERLDQREMAQPQSEMERRYGVVIYNLNTDELARDMFDNCPVRRFDCFCLAHIWDGQGKCWIENYGEFSLSPGSVLLIRPDTWNLYGGLRGTGYREDFVMFNGETIRKMEEQGLVETGLVAMSPMRFLPDLKALLDDPSPESQWAAALKLQSLLLEILQSRKNSLHLYNIENLLKEIQRTPEHWWTVKEMAGYCNISEAQFRRQFFKMTKMLPKNYVEENKQREAARLLTYSSLPIDTIYQRLGYHDRFHFSRRFKEFWGVAPGEYRRLHCKNAPSASD